MPTFSQPCNQMSLIRISSSPLIVASRLGTSPASVRLDRSAMACAYELLQGIDEQSAAVVVQLQLQDAELYFFSSKGKSREGELSDESLAFQLQKQELENFSSLHADNQMARSMATAILTDGQLLTETLSQEEIAARDRDMARQLADGAVQSHNSFDDEFLEKLRVLYVSGFEDVRHDPDGGKLDFADDALAESSAWAASRTSNSSSINRRCEACREERKFFNVARLPCHHKYCHASNKAGECPHISGIRACARLNEKKKVEFETPNRTYCHSPKCSSFVNPRSIDGEVATCFECGLTTCTTCKGSAHDRDCPNDILLEELLDTARENGWQRCYSCWRVVELDHGCNHMTCRCGAQFCYICGQRWKSCACEQWDEGRLLARANQILDREPERLAAVPAPADATRLANAPHLPQEIDPPANPTLDRRNILVAETMQNLRANHECGHSHWRWVQGPHQCEECHHFLTQYIFECRLCRLQACNRCRRNRL
ncbi:IBR finger domain-containing protein [Paracoccidioides lutzii Pb01]|uniref:RBR-type E3 ubiquitin transferase n=1 Tax=Paracoccidioides lutzii (strain ATCC MYA-826 / Pb01) TaxID=502779 RepID=C1H0C0_PARBA|nr:IBR finger domain-containing protein [Paracoccidioides lutzii Pb01]EEH33161.2 IBR finger domain-containing protein [Paracoccidioides lutzii Pb01]